MLSNEEKVAIFEAESYRHEVRQQLEKETPKKTRWVKLSAILNSAFTLWFLSSVVLVSVTSFYARWENKKKIQEEQRERAYSLEREKDLLIRKLDAEIGSRLFYFAIANRYVGVPKAVEDLVKPSEAHYPVTVFPEYASRNLRSLLWELMQVVPPHEKEEIKAAYELSALLDSAYLLSTIDDDKAKGVTFIMHRAITRVYGMEAIRVGLNLERWGKPFNGYKKLERLMEPAIKTALQSSAVAK